MLVVRNPKTSLPMDIPISQEYPFGLVFVDIETAAMHNGKLMLFKSQKTITALGTKEILVITPSVENGIIEIRNIEVLSYQSTGASMITLNIKEDVTCGTNTGDTEVFNMNRTDTTTSNMFVHSSPASITNGSTLPLEMVTERSSVLMSKMKMTNNNAPIKLKSDTKYSFLLTNTDTGSTATVVLKVLIIESV